MGVSTLGLSSSLGSPSGASIYDVVDNGSFLGSSVETMEFSGIHTCIATAMICSSYMTMSCSGTFMYMWTVKTWINID